MRCGKLTRKEGVGCSHIYHLGQYHISGSSSGSSSGSTTASSLRLLVLLECLCRACAVRVGPIRSLMRTKLHSIILSERKPDGRLTRVRLFAYSSAAGIWSGWKVLRFLKLVRLLNFYCLFSLVYLQNLIFLGPQLSAAY